MKFCQFHLKIARKFSKLMFGEQITIILNDVIFKAQAGIFCNTSNGLLFTQKCGATNFFIEIWIPFYQIHSLD